MLASTHKIVGSLTQSAMLLVADGGRVDADAVARAVRLVRSTSPSSLLMASLDAARRQLAVHGEALLDRTIDAVAQARAGDRRDPRLRGRRRAGSSGGPGIAGWDPLRIVIDVRGTGCTGYEVAAALRASYDIYVELATHATLVLVLGLGPADRAARAPRARPRRDGQADRPARDARRVARAPAGASTHETAVPAARRVPRAERGGAGRCRRSGGSRARRSPATRRACRRCCRASASPPRSSPTCGS